MNFQGKIGINAKTYSIRALSQADESILQQLCERCSDYYALCEGTTPGVREAQNIIESLPPDKGIEDKYILGAFDEAEGLIAVMDIIKDFPAEKEWHIGLMMIDPLERGKGIGRKLHDFLVERILVSPDYKLRIGVVEDNVKGLRFWKSMGYHEIKRVMYKFEKAEKPVIVMNYSL